ncbi:MAG: RuvX/YqgF family protein [Nitrospirae bacterium]|nr:RuvX/YqgF family protein [Nitrospirota bacterium]
MNGETQGDDYPLIWEAPLLGIDWGESRIGLAISDGSLRFSEPVGVIRNPCSFKPPFRIPPGSGGPIRQLCAQKDVKGIVFGVPWYHLSGDPNPKSFIFVEYGRLLRSLTGCPVFLWDEGLTSDAFQRTVGAGRGISHRRPKRSRDPIDHYSAALILQSFLDERINSRQIRSGEQP